MEPVPDPGLLPVAQPPPAGDARTAAHLRRQQLPRDAASEHEENAGEGGPVRDARPPAPGLGWLRRQQRFNDGPQLVGQQEFAHPPTVPRRHGF
jgi:hypothetical protein